MPRAVLLQCPVCNSVRALEGNRDEYTGAKLRTIADTHLRDHLLDESTTAIRKHQIAAGAVEVIISAEEDERLPNAAWRERTDAGLPDRVLSDDEMWSEPSAEGASLRSHAED